MTARGPWETARSDATATAQDAAAERFEVQRGLLFGIAYRMLGSVMDAEDAVQDAFLRFRTVEQRGEDVRSDRALLTTIVTRLCLDRLKSAQVVRERYVGPWLPEPLITGGFGPLAATSPEAQVEERETLSMAFLVLLQSLSPDGVPSAAAEPIATGARRLPPARGVRLQLRRGRCHRRAL